jgi:5-methylcytosine-specific restriction endonuclease McrA
LAENVTHLIVEAQLPNFVKERLIRLFGKHGHEWLTKLFFAENPMGDGTSGVRYSLGSQLEIGKPQKAEVPDREIPTHLKDYGLEYFLDSAEDEFYSEDLFPEALIDEYQFREVLDDWVSKRIGYLRTFEGLNTTRARSTAYEETTEVDLGGGALGCNTCGSVFWDNLERLSGVEKHYCSIACQEKVETDCINCGKHFVVGRAKRGFKNSWRLNSFCDVDCYRAEAPKAAADRSYVAGVRKRLEETGAEVDETLTRRAVFEKFEGVCYLCGAKTHWEMKGAWDPLLANVDHIFPVSKGGAHVWENVALACQLCNTRKGAKA